MEVKVQKVATFNPLKNHHLIKHNLQLYQNQRPQSELTPTRFIKTETNPVRIQPINSATRQMPLHSFYNQNKNFAFEQEQKERPLSALIKSPQMMLNQNKGKTQVQKNEIQTPHSFLIKDPYKRQEVEIQKQNQELKKIQVLTKQNYRNYLQFKKELDEETKQNIAQRAKSAKIGPSARQANQNAFSYKQLQPISKQSNLQEQFKNLKLLRLERSNKQFNEVTQLLNYTYQLQNQLKPHSPTRQIKSPQRQMPDYTIRASKPREVYLDIKKITNTFPTVQNVRPQTQQYQKTDNVQIKNLYLHSNKQGKPIMTTEQKIFVASNPKTALYREIFEKKERNGLNLQTDISNTQASLTNSNLKNATKLNEYIIGKIIGQGAYAEVKFAIHKPTNKKVAVKIYDKVKLLDPIKRKNVFREIQIMTKLSHPNIAQLIEAIDSQKQVILVQEFCSGISLHQLLKKQQNRRISEVYAKRIFQQIVSGVAYCHSLDICHRDLKLENILVDDVNYTVKIIDFGFSTMINKKIKIFCGTPSYMAPEIVNKKEFFGQPADI